MYPRPSDPAGYAHRLLVDAVALVLARAGVALPHRGLAGRARHVAAVGLARGLAGSYDH